MRDISYNITIYFVRHGRTEDNDLKIVQGQRDIPLSQKGIEQAHNIANFFVNKNIEKIYSSPLERATQTCEIIQDFLEINNKNVTITNDLIEMNLGEIQGLTKKDAMDFDPEKYNMIFYPSSENINSKTRFNYKYNGGEKVNDLRRRILKFLVTIAKTEKPETVLLAITHQLIMKEILRINNNFDSEREIQPNDYIKCDLQIINGKIVKMYTTRYDNANTDEDEIQNSIEMNDNDNENEELENNSCKCGEMCTCSKEDNCGCDFWKKNNNIDEEDYDIKENEFEEDNVKENEFEKNETYNQQDTNLISIYFVREAESNKDLMKLIGKSNYHLTKKGKKQANAIADALSEENFFDFYSSSSSSSLETANIIKNTLNPSKRVEIINDLDEIDLGNFNDCPIEEIKNNDERKYDLFFNPNKEEENLLERLQLKYGNETINDIRNRILNFIYNLTTYNEGNKTFIAVTHKDIIKEILRITDTEYEGDIDNVSFIKCDIYLTNNEIDNIVATKYDLDIDIEDEQEELVYLKQFEKESTKSVSNRNQFKDEMLEKKIINNTENLLKHSTDIVSTKNNLGDSNMIERMHSKNSLFSNNTISDLEQLLNNKIIGQDRAIWAVTNTIKRSKAGLQNPNKPIASFLFLGANGVGKIDICKALAKSLFNNENAILRIDPANDMKQYAIAKLIGAPMGYMGYDHAGCLTEIIKKMPNQVIYFEDIENIHPEIFSILIQLLNEGQLTDAKGDIVDFRNTIIVMSSHLGDIELSKLKDNESVELAYNLIVSKIKKIFRPEFVSGFDEIVLLRNLTKNDIENVTNLQLLALQNKLKQEGYLIEWTNKLCKYLVSNAYDSEYGIKPLKRAVKIYIENYIANEIVSGRFKPNKKVVLDIKDASGEVFLINE